MYHLRVYEMCLYTNRIAKSCHRPVQGQISRLQQLLSTGDRVSKD